MTVKTPRGPSPNSSVRSTRSAASDTELGIVEGAASISPALSTTSLLSLGGATKKRGRPPTTGEYVGLAAAKKAAVEAEKEALALKSLKARLEGTSATISTSDPLPREDDLREEMREQPTPDLGARILEEMEAVDRMATTSNNLKGTYVRQLRFAARSVRVIATELVLRTSYTADQAAAEEVKRLRSRIASLESKLMSLRGELEALRTEKSIKPTTPPKRTRKTASRFVTSSSDDDTNVEVTYASMREVTTPPRRGPTAPPYVRTIRQDPPPALDEEALLARIEVMMEAKLSAALKASAPAPPPSSNPPKAAPRKPPPRGVPTPVARRKGGPANKPPVQPPPPPPTNRASGSQGTWAQVVGRGRKKGKPEVAKGAPQAPPPAKAGTRKAPPQPKAVPKKAKPGRLPSTAAVAVTVPEKGELTYAEVMRKVKTSVRLNDLGIEEVRYRRAVTGGLLMEIPGECRAEKAAALTERLSEVLEGTGVRVAQPSKRAELRVRGLDDSLTPAEVAKAISEMSGCPVGEIRTGVIRTSPTGRGLGSLWVQCPLAAAKKIVAAGRVRGEWLSAPVDFLPARPLQCYRCMAKGHVRATCTCEVDRAGQCYRCGEAGHKAANCRSAPHCVVCAERGRPAGHRAGGNACPLPPRKKKAGAASAAPAKAAASTSGGKAQPAKTKAGGQMVANADIASLEEAMETAQ